MTDFRALLNDRISDLKAQQERSRDATAVVELDQTRQGRLSRMDAMRHCSRIFPEFPLNRNRS